MDGLINKITEIMRELPYDPRMEVLVNILKDNGIELDKIIISPKSLFTRKFHRDVEQTTVINHKKNKNEQYILTEINREGMYDALPQALIHRSKSNKKGAKDADEIANEVKETRLEEAAARNFFLPFENEFYHQSANIEFEEKTILSGFLGNYHYAGLLNRYWQLPSFLDDRQKATFIYLIPVIHKAAGDLSLTKLCYEALLNIEVNCIMKNGGEQTITNTFCCGNEQLQLGVNFISGNSFYDYTESIEISFNPATEIQVRDYLPGGKAKDVIEFLNSYFLPYHLSYNLKILTSKYQRKFILNDEILALGFTSYI